MKKYIFTTLFLLMGLYLQAQTKDTINQAVSPIGGVNGLAVNYYGIDFTKDQRFDLKGKEIEFVFQVDEYGVPTLSEINGINDISIIDSLKNKTEKIAPFKPRIINGVPKSSIYFMKLTFPTYGMANHAWSDGLVYKEINLDDFEYINKSNKRVDILFGLVANQFIGKPVNYLGLGGGAKLDLSYTDSREFLYGLNMTFYANKRKQDYPLSTNREQFSAFPSLLVGAIFGKWFAPINIQAELNFAVQNITEKINPNDTEWIQLKGWSPGIIVNYPILLGNEKPVLYYGSPTISGHSLNLHLGLRYLSLSIPEASGLMVEIGVSYRGFLSGIKGYKLKDGFYKN